MLCICNDWQHSCTARLYLLSAKIKTFHLTLCFKRMPPCDEAFRSLKMTKCTFNPLNTKLNPICHLLALVGTRHILHVSRVMVKLNVPQKFRAKVCPAPVPTITVFCFMSIPTGKGTRTSSSVPVPQLPCSFQPQLTILPVPARSKRAVCICITRDLETTVTFMSDMLRWAMKEIKRH